ncbi:hypothetical protein HORIV_48940 [Vreelandella olivaria]|uniref:Transposase n=1 Tax=Vreelandella olivaria TaxID=390919 RepID=A0ABM7GPB0_9GAMM|nr:hypothetical protein HORIV_48940 [Halomonas olivaria]
MGANVWLSLILAGTASYRELFNRYYSQLRPHQHNSGMSPNQAEEKYWVNYKAVASFT